MTKIIGKMSGISRTLIIQYLMFFLLLIGFVSEVSGQNFQEKYLSGKQFFNEGKYNLAMESFKELANPNATHEFREYASFYYALSAYKNGQLGLARSMWLQIESKYPRWNKITEVYAWLSEVYFEEKNYVKGVEYANKSGNREAPGLINKYLSDLKDIDQISQLNEANPDDKLIARIYSKSILEQPLGERDFNKLRELTNKFEFGTEFLGNPEVGASTMKDSYKVAVLLPFLFDSLSNTRRIERNQFITDIYHGILMAADDLNSKKRQIEIYPYDTRRSKKATAKILQKAEMKSMDLIIGPLYPEPSKLTSEFSFANKINMVNPLSSNSAIIGENPFSFLMKPTHEQQAIRAAEFVLDSLTERKKNAYVFFDQTEKDSIMAQLYVDELKKQGYEILHQMKIDDDQLLLINERITETYELDLTEEEADSIRNIPGRIVKEEENDLEEDPKADSLRLFEERYTIEWDSIGHIFLASSKPLYASTFISATEIRGDQIPIIGRQDWLKHDMISLDQVERLGVYFTCHELLIPKNDQFLKFRDAYISKYRAVPTLNSMYGYETMVVIGGLMIKYGNYFQNGSLQEGFVEGKLFYGFDFSFANCNQFVPVVQLINSELKVINK